MYSWEASQIIKAVTNFVVLQRKTSKIRGIICHVFKNVSRAKLSKVIKLVSSQTHKVPTILQLYLNCKTYTNCKLNRIIKLCTNISEYLKRKQKK